MSDAGSTILRMARSWVVGGEKGFAFSPLDLVLGGLILWFGVIRPWLRAREAPPS